ncbi:MAG: hypothetical protein KHZ52_09020 [Actinomyces graevenitzii]|nr:hypothetical protein [Actinomyces graevenitzii]
MRYENPLYTAENAAQADLISASRLQLGVGRGGQAAPSKPEKLGGGAGAGL